MKDKNLKSEETESSWILPAVRKACRGFLKYEGKHTMYTQTYIFIKWDIDIIYTSVLCNCAYMYFKWEKMKITFEKYSPGRLSQFQLLTMNILRKGFQVWYNLTSLIKQMDTFLIKGGYGIMTKSTKHLH